MSWGHPDQEDQPAAGISCLVASAGVLLLTTRTPIAWIVIITLVFGVTLGTTAWSSPTARS